MPDLTEAFAAYLSGVSADLERRLQPTPGTPRRSAKAVALPSATQEWLNECEQSPSWQNLLDACPRWGGYEWPENEDWDETQPMDERRLKNWIRRSGIYASLLDGGWRVADLAKEAAEQLYEDASEPNEELLFLAVLDGVSFEREMHFREFDIVKPTAAELTAILDIETHRRFYPRAITSVGTLAEHWYLRAKDRREKPKPPRINIGYGYRSSYIAVFRPASRGRSITR